MKTRFSCLMPAAITPVIVGAGALVALVAMTAVGLVAPGAAQSARADSHSGAGGETLDRGQAQKYMDQSFPNVQVEDALPSGLQGFSAVTANGQVYYISHDGMFLIAGTVFNVRDSVSLNERAQAVLRGDDPAAVKRAELPDVRALKSFPSKLKGFATVIAAGGKVYYKSDDGKFLIAGTLFNLRDNVNLGERVKASLRKESLANIKQENLLTYAPEEYRHTVRVFSDVNCPYCRKLHGQLNEFQKRGIRVDYILVPFLGDEAVRQTINVWCSDDRQAALDKAMAGEAIAKASCDSDPVADNLALARTLNVAGTPTFLLDDGRLLSGPRSPQDLLHELQNP